MISVNIIAGSGMDRSEATRGIFSDMIEHVQRLIDPTQFEVVVTERLDESRLYDVYHYWHSTLAVVSPRKLHRSLVTIHALDNLAPNRSFEGKEEVLKRARAVSVMSEDMIDVLSSRGVDMRKVSWTPAGIDLQAFLQPEGHERSGPIRLGVVGTRYDDGRKGEEFLTAILKELAFKLEWDPRGTDVTVVFIGRNWRELGLDSMFAESNHLKFEYHVRGEDCTYDDYPGFYHDLDGILVTSKVDAGPVCILEGVAAGIPVISTPTGLANSLLSHRLQNGDRIGQVVPHGGVADFVEAIDDLIITPQSLNWSADYRRNASIDVFGSDPFYSTEAFVARFAAIYAEIAASCDGKMYAEDFVNEEVYNRVNAEYGPGARNALEEVYLRNFTLIRHYVQDGVGLNLFGGALSGKPAVILGAGPSLDDAKIATLKKYRDKVVVIACDALLPKLKKLDLYPDIVVTVDPSDRQVENFRQVDGRKFISMMASVVDPMTFNESRKSDCSTVWYHVADSGIPLCRAIPTITGAKGAVRPAVLTPGMAYQIAIFLDCWPITFIGTDLCYSDLNKGYTSGLSQAKENYQRNTKIFGGPLFAFPDLDGKIVLTESCFMAFHAWINEFLESYDMSVYNSSGQGIMHGERIVQMPFEEWCEKFASPTPISVVPILKGIYYEQKVSAGETVVTPGYDEDVLEDMRRARS